MLDLLFNFGNALLDLSKYLNDFFTKDLFTYNGITVNCFTLFTIGGISVLITLLVIHLIY